MERLREVFAELQGSLEDAKALSKAVAEQFPHRGINDVKRQLREMGLLQQSARKGRGKGDKEEEREKSEWTWTPLLQ